MQTYELSTAEVAQLRQLSQCVIDRFGSVETPEFYSAARTLGQELPRGLRTCLNDFRLSESHAVLVINGWPVDDAALMPTPTETGVAQGRQTVLIHDTYLCLVGAALGDPIGWRTQQDGRLVHDIFPVRKWEGEQIGWSSASDLLWHTEDAFHPFRTDYLALLCLRNPQEAATTVAALHDVELALQTREALAEVAYEFIPDAAHVLGGAAEKVPGAVLEGAADDPYLRVDPAYMAEPSSQRHRDALQELCDALSDTQQRVALPDGSLCLIDNYRAVHGREPFAARYDGTDRWLRRLNIARDLRRSRAARSTAASPVIS